MAVSKIWPLYQTLDKAINYICNPEKTQDGTLIETYKCSERFADYEFADIFKNARKVKKPRIAYHCIISFSPKDNITPEQALEVGKEIMDKYTRANHQYVLSVHTDQEHIHVHCIFNSVAYKKFDKFQIKNKDLDRLEKITDRICKAHGLSVIEEKSGEKGMGKYAYEKHKKGLTLKDQLREAIDRSILAASSYDEFLILMQMEEGYEIKQGKYLSFTIDNNGKKYTMRNRGDKYGFDESYSIEGIKDRIFSKNRIPEENKNLSENSLTKSDKTSIKRLINIDENQKAQEHTAYRRKLEMINISTYAGMINFVKKYNLVYVEDFKRTASELEEKYASYTDKIRSVYSELVSLESDVVQFEIYFSNQELHKKYAVTSDKDLKYQLSAANKKYEGALYYFKKNNIKINEVTEEKIKEYHSRIKELHSQLEQLKDEREDVKNDIKQLAILEENNKKILSDEIQTKDSEDYSKIQDSDRNR